MKTFCKLTAQSPAASYVPLPRFLLQDEALRDISNDAKVLYALLLDRASISWQNGYVEPDGTIRLYFTLEQAQAKLHRSRQSAVCGRISPSAGDEHPWRRRGSILSCRSGRGCPCRRLRSGGVFWD